MFLSGDEYDAVQRASRNAGQTVSEWVRQALRQARRDRSADQVDDRLTAIRQAVQHRYPTGDIEEMLSEIETGYQG